MAAITMPQIDSVAITPNPVEINKSFKIEVSVSEVAVAMYTSSPLSGSFHSNQSIKLTTRNEVVD